MLTSISHTKAVAGCRAFGNVRPRVAPRISQVCHMTRSTAYMVEVENISDVEPEDMVVRRYMKLVMQSRVLEKLRARKTKETKIQEKARRFRERVEMNKAGFVEPCFKDISQPTWDEPFGDFFRRDGDDPEGPYDNFSGAEEIFGTIDGAIYPDTTWGYDNAGAGSQGGSYVGGGAYGSTGAWQNSAWQGGYMQ